MLRSLLTFFFSVFFIFISWTDVEAQARRSKRSQVKHRFNAGLIIGGNLSQIDGDQYTGFDKLGFRGGLKGSMYLDEQLDIVIGFIYNQKGSRFEGLPGYPSERGKTRSINYDYMEVPLLISYKLKSDKEAGYVLEGGFSYARMIDFEVSEKVFDLEREVSYALLTNDFNLNEFNFIAGINYYFNRHIGVGFHYTLQMNKVYENPLFAERNNTLAGMIRNDPETRIPLLRNYQMALHLVYNIF